MLFNSVDFFIFLFIIFVLYWTSKKKEIQNVILLIGSYIFYGWWDWRFLSLIAISSISDYIIGLQLDKTNNLFRRKCWLILSLTLNLGILGFFKYFNFFIHTFCAAFLRLGIHLNEPTLSIILPVGISFYTFQTLSYTLDIYKKHMKPTTDVIAFLTFVSFFPQLVAGPIERAKNLLPQFQAQRQFNDAIAIDGTRQMLWGLFKKMIIADNCVDIC